MDLMKSVERVHDCVHQASAETRAGFEKVHDRISSVKSEVSSLSNEVSYMKGAQEATRQALGVQVEGEPAPKKTLALLTPAKAVWMGLGTVGAAMIGYRVLAEIGPHVWAFLKALHHILMTAPTA